MKRGLLCFFLICLFQSYCKSAGDETVFDPFAISGRLDLRNWDSSKSPMISLKGNWEFYPSKLLTYGSFPKESSLFHEVPLIWNGKLDPNQKNGLGSGTLRLRVYDLPEEEFMVYVSSIPTAHRLYCGPDLILYSGTVSDTERKAIPNLGSSLGSLSPKCRVYGEFIWQISNFHEFKGGPWTVPYLGTKNRILIQFSNSIIQDIFFLGVTAIMGVYHFVLWLFRKKDKRSLTFSIICFLFMIRIIGTGKILEFYFPHAELYEWMNTFEYFGYVGLIIVFPWLWKILFPNDIFAMPLYFNSLFGAFFLGVILFFPSIAYTSLLSYIQLQTLIIIIFVSSGLFFAIYRNRPGAKIMGVGYLFVIATILHDLFLSHKLIYGIHIAPIGFFVFLVSQSTILAKIFSNAFLTAEHLTENLQSEVDAKTKALKREDEQKTAFFANISHELRTPLTLILGPIEAALTKRNELTESKLSIVYKNAKRLSNLVNQLLDLQKLIAGKFQLSRISFSLEEMSNEILQEFSFLFEKKQIKTSIFIESKTPIVFADPNQIEKCIHNLLSNALKFTPSEGSISIRIKEGENKQILYEIQDTGLGIEEEKIPRLFQRFGYSEVSLTKEQEGTGLGLSLVRELIEFHGGEIGLSSKRGEGSTFWFTLPKAEINSTVKSISTNKDLLQILISVLSAGAEDSAQNNLTKKKERDTAKILVVEDNPDLGSYLQELLEEAGYQVFRAFDGEEGLSKIFQIMPDLVITDLMMPKKSGTDLIHTYKSDRRFKTIPSILLTAKAEESTRKEVTILGSDAYLAKPFLADELLALIKNLLRIKDKERYLLKEYEKAKKIQESLLPKITNDHPEFTIVTFIQSQDSIGGDFYDMLELRDRKLRYMIADVSGHGLSAALIAGSLKLLFQKSSYLSLEDFLEATNSDLRGNLAGNFITAQLFDLDLESEMIEVANAGHPAFLLIRQGKVQRFQIPGKALGLMEGNLYPKISIPLEKGDRIVLYTDGITEVQDTNKVLFGEDRWEALLESNYSLPIELAKENILSTIYDFSGSNGFSDDATFLILDWKGKKMKSRLLDSAFHKKEN